MQKVFFAKQIHEFNKLVSFDGTSIVDEQDANYPHTETSLSKYEDSPFAVASFEPENVKVELHKSSWTTLGDFPFVSTYFGFYSTVTIDGEVYIFGELHLNPFSTL